MTDTPAEPLNAEKFWKGRCLACAHPAHPLMACREVWPVRGDPANGPEYCPCADQLEAMEAEIARLRAATRESAGAELVEALWQQTEDEIERLERDWARLSGDYPRATSVVPVREVRTTLIGILQTLRLAAHKETPDD